MTDSKIEVIFNEAIVVGDKLEKNIQKFNQNYQKMEAIYLNIEQIAQLNQITKKEEANKFTQEIKKQVDRYYTALQGVNLDTTSIEKLIKEYNITIAKQINGLEKSAHTISQTIHKNGNAIIAAAQKMKMRRLDMMFSFIIFTSGVLLGALGISAYPIAEASKAFYAELKERDAKVQALKEQYETNDDALAFLRENNIKIEYGKTDDSWERDSMKFAPMVLFPKDSVIQTDETTRSTRIIFKKTEGERE